MATPSKENSMKISKQLINNNKKEKTVKNKTVPVKPKNNKQIKEAAKSLNVPIVTKHESLGANFDVGHISKMSSLIKISDMFVDYQYQRSPLKAKINRIVKNFDPDLLGVITCSMREDNTLAIIDGSHRYHAMLEMGMKDANVNALVYFGLTLEDEAHIFALTNKEHTKPTPAQIFKAGIVAGDETAIGISNVVAKIGAEVHFAPGPNRIRCVAAVRKVYTNAGPAVLEKALRTLKNAYPDNKEMFRDQMISAVSCIYNRYGKKVNEQRLTEALTKLGSPSLVIAQAQAMISSGQTVTFTSLPYLIVSRYNMKLRENRLTDFPMSLLAQQVWTSKG